MLPDRIVSHINSGIISLQRISIDNRKMQSDTAATHMWQCRPYIITANQKKNKNKHKRSWHYFYCLARGLVNFVISRVESLYLYVQ